MADDQSLVQRCAGGDQRAWRELVDRFAGYVTAIARMCALRDDEVEDVVQSTFAALARRIADVEDDRALPAWLRTTATREAWRAGRVSRRHGVAAGGEEVPAAADPDVLIRIEDHRRLREALELLGGRCRELLRLLYFGPEQHSYEAVSEALGMPIGSIGPTRRRCLAKLLGLFESDSGERAGG